MEVFMKKHAYFVLIIISLLTTSTSSNAIVKEVLGFIKPKPMPSLDLIEKSATTPENFNIKEQSQSILKFFEKNPEAQKKIISIIQDGQTKQLTPEQITSNILSMIFMDYGQQHSTVFCWSYKTLNTAKNFALRTTSDIVETSPTRKAFDRATKWLFGTTEESKSYLYKVSGEIQNFSKRNWQRVVDSYWITKQYIKFKYTKPSFFFYVVLPIIITGTMYSINVYKIFRFFCEASEHCHVKKIEMCAKCVA
jgi:hypothetical protein